MKKGQVKLNSFQKAVKKKVGKQVLKQVLNRELVVHQRIFFKPPNLINLSKIAIFIQKFKIVILKIQILKAVKMQRKQTKKQNNQLKVKLQLKQFNKRKIKHIQIIKQLLKLKEAVIIDEKALQKLVKKMVVQMAEIVVLKLRKNVELLNNQVVAILKILF